MKNSIYYIKPFNDIVLKKMRNIYGHWFLDLEKCFLIDKDNVIDDIKFK